MFGFKLIATKKWKELMLTVVQQQVVIEKAIAVLESIDNQMGEIEGKIYDENNS